MSEVVLRLYDLSRGLTSAIDMPEIIHTSLVVYGKEIEFGPKGITVMVARKGSNNLIGSISLGRTNEDDDVIMKYLSYLNDTKFNGKNYNVLTFNCNSFTKFLSTELIGEDNTPPELQELPGEVFKSGVRNVIGWVFACKSLYK